VGQSKSEIVHKNCAYLTSVRHQSSAALVHICTGMVNMKFHCVPGVLFSSRQMHYI